MAAADGWQLPSSPLAHFAPPVVDHDALPAEKGGIVVVKGHVITTPPPTWRGRTPLAVLALAFLAYGLHRTTPLTIALCMFSPIRLSDIHYYIPLICSANYYKYLAYLLTKNKKNWT